MAIVSVPDDLPTLSSVCCTACNEAVALADATAGLQDGAGRQAFACNCHFVDGVSFMHCWIDFVLANDARRLAQSDEVYGG